MALEHLVVDDEAVSAEDLGRARNRASAYRYDEPGLGVIDAAGLNAVFESVDANDDELICFKSYSSNANPTSQQQYAYNVVDNNASLPSG